MLAVGKIRRHLSVLAFSFALLCSIPIRSLGYGPLPAFGSHCSEELSAINLANFYRAFQYVPYENEDGFSLLSPGVSDSTPERNIEIPPDPFDTDFISKVLWKNIWQDGLQKFEFFNVGYRNLDTYSARVNQAVATHIALFPDHNLNISYTPIRTYVAKQLKIHRWAVHDSVLNEYEKRKEYLTDYDFMTLETLNKISGHSDVFGLMKYHQGSTFMNQDHTAITDRLMIAIQITYFGDRDFMKPSLRHVLLDSNYPIYEKEDKLPFEYRILPQKLEAFRKRFYARFKPSKTCEFLRYGIFDQELPEPIKAAFILKAFKTAKDRGMEHIVISVDKGTAKLFGPLDEAKKTYKFLGLGFEPWEILPTGQTLKTEYVMYMDIDSPRYNFICNLLEKIASSVSSYSEDLK